MTQTQIQNKVTKTNTFDGSNADVSGVIGDWTLVLDIQKLSGTARFVFEDSNDAFFSDILAGPTVSVTSGAGGGPQQHKFHRRDFPNFRAGIASVIARLSIVEFTGAGKSVTYQAWIESGV